MNWLGYLLILGSIKCIWVGYNDECVVFKTGAGVTCGLELLFFGFFLMVVGAIFIFNDYKSKKKTEGKQGEDE